MFIPRVIPTLLLKNNGLVKTIKFKNEKYIGDPINAVKIFNEKEVDEIIFLDINASKIEQQPNFDMLERISSECFMPLAYGGGIKTIEQVKKILRIGVEKVIINSAAINNFNFIKDIINVVGSQSVIISIDIKKSIFGKYKVFSYLLNKNIKIELMELLEIVNQVGVGEVFINSVDRDGMMNGYDIELLKLVSSSINMPLVACGGASNFNHLKDGLKLGGANAVSAGSMFVYHGKHNAVLINYLNKEELDKINLNEK